MGKDSYPLRRSEQLLFSCNFIERSMASCNMCMYSANTASP
nr:MAG TPA: hypothetical protein [Caudoviricetes sp.]